MHEGLEQDLSVAEQAVADLLSLTSTITIPDYHDIPQDMGDDSTDKCCMELGLEGLDGMTAEMSFNEAAAEVEAPEEMLNEEACTKLASTEASASAEPEKEDEPEAPREAATVFKDLHTSALAGNLERVRKLICQGAMVNAPICADDEEGDVFITLLHLVAGRADLPKGTEVLSEIVRGKANLNARSFMGSTPLARACLHKHRDAVEALLAFGADTRPVDDRGRNAIRCAVSMPMTAPPAACSNSLHEVSGGLVSLLAAKSADLDSGGDMPPLLEAVRQGNRPAVAALISNGAKPNYLHAAVDAAPTCIIEELLKAQANPFEEDCDGKTVLDIAFRRGDEEITTLLRDFIGDLERRNVNGFPAVSVPSGRRLSSHSSEDTGVETMEDNDMTLGLSAEFGGRSGRNTESSGTSGSARQGKRRFSFGGTSMSMLSGPKRRMLKKSTVMQNEGSSSARKAFAERMGKFQLSCRRLNRNRNFQMVMFAALLAVLFFPDLWVVCDVSGSTGLDVVLIIVLLLFAVELLMQTIGTPKTYINSFFFWMDIVGLLSVPLDLSVVTEGLPQNLDNAVVMRAARTARLGARAGRFTKLVKLLRFLPGVQQDDSAKGGTAKTMSNALMTSLSTRVSCLIIVMVMVLPLFEMATYPENDFSMKTWMNSLDFTLGRYGTTVMQRRLLDFENFYSNKDYYPIEVQWDMSGNMTTQRLKGRRPRRQQNELEIRADSGTLRAVFNFGPQNRVDALCNMILMVVIIVLMMGFSMLLSSSVSTIVLRPLENLLDGVKGMASKIFNSVTHMAASCSAKECEESDEHRHGDESEFGDFGNETQLLEKVIDKLATLSAITMKTTAIDAETFNELGETDRAVLQGFSPEQLPTIQIRKSDGSGTSARQSFSKRADHTEELVQTLEKYLEQAGLAWGLIDSWDFNVLAIEEKQRQLTSLSFLIFHLGLRYSSEMQTRLAGFVEVAASGYYNSAKVPYHNWYHAVDVTHGVFRLLNTCATERFLSNLERFSLIASALCHDIGHPGQNNPFLVETAHELAIRYNDRSPLENMHCARLFEIVSQPKTAIFENFEKKEYREARQVCIEAILHTDNVHHFAMVKEMQMLYEMNSDVFDIALQMHQMGQVDFPPREICEILGDSDKKRSMRNLILHFSDISNPMKPFEICKMWAWNIIDEFFLQGDKEKELGITVQPLNDREKVNKPYSQVGFIEFFVAPFAFATVRVLPPLISCTDQMMQNLHTWCEEWINTTTPAPEAEEVAKLHERIGKLEAKFVLREGF